MLIEALCWLVEQLINAILSVLEILPDFPAAFVKIIDSFFNLIFDNLYLFSFFVRIETVQIAIPIVIAVMNFEHIYSFVMWILRKIPTLGIK